VRVGALLKAEDAKAGEVLAVRAVDGQSADADQLTGQLF
jgi:hypothetical protein